MIFVCVHLSLDIYLNHKTLRQDIFGELIVGFKREMNEVSHSATSMSFPVFSMSACIVGFGFSVALIKKCAAAGLSFLACLGGPVSPGA